MSTSLRAISIRSVVLAVNLAYPFLVYGVLRYLSAAVLVVGFAAYLIVRLVLARLNRGSAIGAAELWLVGLAGGAALIWTMLSPIAGLKVYPIFISTGFAIIFSYSLLFPPTVVERIARLHRGDISPAASAYLWWVTAAWVAFFLLNGTISAITALSGNLELWMLYNGFISYLMVGSMFAGELLVRRYMVARFDRVA